MKNIFTLRGQKPGRKTASAKKSVVPVSGYQSLYYNIGSPLWSGRNYKKFADEAYTKNVIAHQAVSQIARSASSVKFKIKKLGQTLDPHFYPLSKLLAAPNPAQGGAELLESIFSFKLISGNAYILAIGANADEAPIELYALRPDRVSVIAGHDEMPAGYRYSLGNNRYRDYDTSQVLHLKFFHPLDDWYGLSPVEAAAYSIDQHNQAGAWNQALLQNGARPSGALVMKSDNGLGGRLGEDQYNRMKVQIDEQFSGAANAGRPILLEGGMDWKEMSMSPKDMDYIEMKNSAARDIALAFGVPPQLLGIPGDNTYSNLAEARLALWEQTIIPHVSNLVDALNNWLTPKFDPQVKIEADLDNIPALSPRRDDVWNRINNATFLTVEEKKKLLNL